MTLVYRVKDNNSIENNIDNKLQNRNIFYNHVTESGLLVNVYQCAKKPSAGLI